MTNRNLKTGLVAFTAIALGVLANGTTFAQNAPAGVPTTTNGQAPPPGTLPPTFGGGGHWGDPKPNPDGSAEQPFINVNPDGTEEIVSWAHIPAPPPAPEGFADPNVEKISISDDGQITRYHYKDGTIIGKNRDGKVVLVIAPVAVTAPKPAPAPAPAPAPQAVPHPGDRPVGGGMYEKAGTGVKMLEGFIDVPPKKVENGPKIHLGDEPPRVGMATPHVHDHGTSTSTLAKKLENVTAVHQGSATAKSSSFTAAVSRGNGMAALETSKVEPAAKKLQFEASAASRMTSLKLAPSKLEPSKLPAIAMTGPRSLTPATLGHAFAGTSLGTAVITSRVGAVTISRR